LSLLDEFWTSQVRDTAATEELTASSCCHWMQLLVTHVVSSHTGLVWLRKDSGKISRLPYLEIT
jgi:hypothetical protein